MSTTDCAVRSHSAAPLEQVRPPYETGPEGGGAGTATSGGAVGATVSRAPVPVVVAVGEAVVVRLADCDDPPPEDMANAINMIRRRKPAAAPPRMTQALLGVDDVADGALAGVADMPTL